MESDKSLEYELGSFCYLCLPGAVVAYWFLIQEIARSNTPFCHMIIHKFCRFLSINLEKTQLHTSEIFAISKMCGISVDGI